jgi:hypothetical protein
MEKIKSTAMFAPNFCNQKMETSKIKSIIITNHFLMSFFPSLTFRFVSKKSQNFSNEKFLIEKKEWSNHQVAHFELNITLHKNMRFL